jgi:sulfur-oxidizing protein SoxZ
MASGVKPRVKVPKTASAGETVTIKTLISHPMESGQRKDSDGNPIPRSIINRFTADFNGQNVIDVTLEPAISTNPYFEFQAIVPESGEFKFTWYDDDGSVYEAANEITVSLSTSGACRCRHVQFHNREE